MTQSRPGGVAHEFPHYWLAGQQSSTKLGSTFNWKPTMRLSPETISSKADRPPFRWRKCLFTGMAAALSLSAAPAHADTYPSKTITIVVGFAPGGLIDGI